MGDRPHTHSQFKDTPGDKPCGPGNHHFVPLKDNGDDWVGDDSDEGVPFVCTYCGESDIEPEDGA